MNEKKNSGPTTKRYVELTLQRTLQRVETNVRYVLTLQDVDPSSRADMLRDMLSDIVTALQHNALLSNGNLVEELT